MGNKPISEDPLVTKEKSVKEKIQILYKSENKRTAESDQNLCKKPRKLPPKSNLGGDKIEGEQNEIASPKEKSGNKGKYECKTNVKSVRKVERSRIKIKISPKKSPIPKVSSQKRSPSPKLRSEKGSPVPIQTSKIVSPGPNLGTETGSLDQNLEFLGIESRKGGTVERLSAAKSDVHPKMIDSPSLKPVKIRNLIENFERNIDSKTALNGQKAKKIDVFEALMMSGGKGDTLGKTPPKKKKPKRLNSISSTKKEATVMTNWLKKIKENNGTS